MGGSNLAFGIDCKMIEDTLNIPVVNLGLHGGLGLDFILNEAQKSSTSGDIIVLSIEYFLNHEGSYKLKRHTSMHYPPANKYYRKNIFKEIELHTNQTREDMESFTISSTPIENKGAKDKLYARSSFNKYGDVIGHLDRPQPKYFGNRGKKTYRYWDGIDRLKKFNKYAESNQISVFYIFPTFPSSEYLKSKAAIDKLTEDIRLDTGIEILGTHTDFIFKDSLFFDSVYHLNKVGRKKRTIKVIELLKSRLVPVDKQAK